MRKFDVASTPASAADPASTATFHAFTKPLDACTEPFLMFTTMFHAFNKPFLTFNKPFLMFTKTFYAFNKPFLTFTTMFLMTLIVKNCAFPA